MLKSYQYFFLTAKSLHLASRTITELSLCVPCDSIRNKYVHDYWNEYNIILHNNVRLNATSTTIYKEKEKEATDYLCDRLKVSYIMSSMIIITQRERKGEREIEWEFGMVHYQREQLGKIQGGEDVWRRDSIFSIFRVRPRFIHTLTTITMCYKNAEHRIQNSLVFRIRDDIQGGP